MRMVRLIAQKRNVKIKKDEEYNMIKRIYTDQVGGVQNEIL